MSDGDMRTAEADLAFLNEHYPNSIHLNPYLEQGYWWENIDGHRFYFFTELECANDLAFEMGVTDKEREPYETL